MTAESGESLVLLLLLVLLVLFALLFALLFSFLQSGALVAANALQTLTTHLVLQTKGVFSTLQTVLTSCSIVVAWDHHC